MSGSICYLCFEECNDLKANFLQCAQNTEIQEFVDLFCQFVFNNAPDFTLDEVCTKCWTTVFNFGLFCMKIKGIHQNLIEDSCDVSGAMKYGEETKTSIFTKYDEHTQVLEDEIEEIAEELIAIDEIDSIKSEPMLSIESDQGDDFNDGDTSIKRMVVLTPKIIKKLEDQLNFEAKTIEIADMNFDRISTFITMECVECKHPFDSFEECNKHYLLSHNRSAYWNCCNLLLETPYELLDHVRYHESIDVFKCAACSKCFLNSNKLKYHIRRSHLPVDGLFECTLCDKKFRTLRLLLNHQKSHIQINCPYCVQQNFITAANYDNHIRTAHANQISNKKRKIKVKNVTGHKKHKDGTSGSNKLSHSLSNRTANQIFLLNIEPNEIGMYECDICNMQFKQISLVFSHRNKVHV